MLTLCTKIGFSLIRFLSSVGKISLFTSNALLNLFTRPVHFNLIIKQMIDIGYYSLTVVGLTAFFTGAVLALQSYTGFARFSAESSIATVVVLSITRELGPVLAGLMVSGRIGAAMAAEIASMRVTEQIDALKSLSTNPIKYLVTPRILASVIMLPLLVIISDIIGVMGGYLIAVHKLGFNPVAYLKNTFQYLKPVDVISGLTKAAVFGFIIAMISCYSGYNSKRGAQGVGGATTNAVVSSSILILLFNYIITGLFFGK